MRVDLFDFDLDKELIAKEPANPRDASRLLDLSEEGVTVDRHFYDLPDILHSGDVLVFNDTKVIPARLYGKRGEAEVEVTLYHPENGQTWWAFVKTQSVCIQRTKLLFIRRKLRRKNHCLKRVWLKNAVKTAYFWNFSARLIICRKCWKRMG